MRLFGPTSRGHAAPSFRGGGGTRACCRTCATRSWRKTRSRCCVLEAARSNEVAGTRYDADRGARPALTNAGAMHRSRSRHQPHLHAGEFLTLIFFFYWEIWGSKGLPNGALFTQAQHALAILGVPQSRGSPTDDRVPRAAGTAPSRRGDHDAILLCRDRHSLLGTASRPVFVDIDPIRSTATQTHRSAITPQDHRDHAVPVTAPFGSIASRRLPTLR